MHFFFSCLLHHWLLFRLRFFFRFKQTSTWVHRDPWNKVHRWWKFFLAVLRKKDFLFGFFHCKKEHTKKQWLHIKLIKRLSIINTRTPYVRIELEQSKYILPGSAEQNVQEKLWIMFCRSDEKIGSEWSSSWKGMYFVCASFASGFFDFMAWLTYLAENLNLWCQPWLDWPFLTISWPILNHNSNWAHTFYFYIKRPSLVLCWKSHFWFEFLVSFCFHFLTIFLKSF